MPRGRPKGSKNQPQQITPTMTEDQKKAIVRMHSISANLLASYHHLCHPTYDEVVELDNAFINFRFEFKELLEND